MVNLQFRYPGVFNSNYTVSYAFIDDYDIWLIYSFIIQEFSIATMVSGKGIFLWYFCHLYVGLFLDGNIWMFIYHGIFSIFVVLENLIEQ